jgi:hypothetical protein
MNRTGISSAVLVATLGILSVLSVFTPGRGGMAGAATASITAIPPRHATVKTLSPQQIKLKRCSGEAAARKLNGAPRQNFIKYCMKQPLPATAASRPKPPPTNRQ